MDGCLQLGAVSRTAGGSACEASRAAARVTLSLCRRDAALCPSSFSLREAVDVLALRRNDPSVTGPDSVANAADPVAVLSEDATPIEL